jgi:hypothetical protein
MSLRCLGGRGLGFRLILDGCLIAASVSGLGVCTWAYSAVVFSGKIVQGPSVEKGWIYVLGQNRSLRRVRLGRARIHFPSSVPKMERTLNPQESLRVGAHVRVTAEQGEDGEWQATEIEILKFDPGENGIKARTM